MNNNYELEWLPEYDEHEKIMEFMKDCTILEVRYHETEECTPDFKVLSLLIKDYIHFPTDELEMVYKNSYPTMLIERKENKKTLCCLFVEPTAKASLRSKLQIKKTPSGAPESGKC